MKSSKSFGTLAGQQQHQPKSNGQQQQQQQPCNSSPTSPICRCRVMYLGSSVPHITKDGLQGIQEPLRELYPDKASLDQGNAGIDSWLSVWSNGILIENVDDNGREVKRFFKIEALHYCAAVKFVPQVGEHSQSSANNLPKFLPLDSPHARLQQQTSNGTMHPPIFASILRRTTGVKVLECHAFICKREAAANALVRCCFHAYADTMYAKQIGADLDSTAGVAAAAAAANGGGQSNGAGPPIVTARRSKSIANLNDPEIGNDIPGEYSDSNSGRNQRQQQVHQQYALTMSRRKSLTSNHNQAQNGNTSDTSQSIDYANHHSLKNNLQRQHNFSKSMHQLNQPPEMMASGGPHYGRLGDFVDSSLSLSQYNLSGNKSRQQVGADLAVPPEPFNNPYASRVPSYPPQSIIDQQTINNTGTLRSVKSMAANSIASTLLRSKKHAKAMSMAQLNQQQQNLEQHITSFHQPQQLHHQQAATMCGPGSFMTLPPVPPMFLPNLPRLPHQMNGSQTMKLPSRNQQNFISPFSHFDTMTPKEIKKLLKKSAKYGLDPGKFALDNSGGPAGGLPLLPAHMMPPQPPPQIPPMHHHMMPSSKSGTMGSRSLYSMDAQLAMGPPSHHDMPDFASPYGAHGLGGLPSSSDMNGGMPPPPPPHMMQPIKSILVKPNPEFLKSKAGKKWLKQQKEFKKLLPPHLDGLPIVFGPPPIDALEPANGATMPPGGPPSSNGSLPPPPAAFLHGPPPPPPLLPPPPPNASLLPVMDSNGYYNPHPFYGPSGRASAASTLLRYSPHSQMQMQLQQQQQQQQQLQHQIHDNHMINGQHELDMMQSRHSQAMYSDPSILINQQQQQFSVNKSHNSPLFYGVPAPSAGSQLAGTFEQQFPYDNDRMSGHHAHRRRNHMVEQSVISLGDEAEGEEDDDEEAQQNGQSNGSHENQRTDDEDDDQQPDGYYDQVQPMSSANGQAARNKPPRRRHERHQNSSESNYQEASSQQQQQPPNDDHSSYSSAGIYRRKHINERAFSYSIRQEHKSNAGSNSDADYSDSHYNQQHQDSNNNHKNRNLNYQQQQVSTYDNPQQLYQNRAQLQQQQQQQQQQQLHYANRNAHHQQQVDELSARLENQLNMKSFPNNNSGVKSHM